MRTSIRVSLLFAGALTVGCTNNNTSTVTGIAALSLVTYNLYIGVDVMRVLGSPITPAAVDAAFGVVEASDPPGRMDAVAGQIATGTPDVVGLVEAALWRTQSPPDAGATQATDVRYDFVQLILDGLTRRGLSYARAAEAANTDIELSGTSQDVRLTDRDVILVRTDGRVAISASDQEKFTAQLVAPVTNFGTLTIERGFIQANATAGGQNLSLVETHLEAAADPIRDAQAAELLARAGQSSPLVMMGDFNFKPDSTPYNGFTAAGLTDEWARLLPNDPGYTCCQDEDLRNATSNLTARIDLMFSRGPVHSTSGRLLGATADTKTASGVWPSDHAGVFMDFQIAP